MQVGTIQGEVNTSSFKFRATEEVKKFDFVSVKSNDQWILAQVEEVTKNPDGSTVANANIIGYRDKGLTKAPRRVIEPDSIVYMADQELISDTLGLEENGLCIGNLETNPDIDIFVNKENFYKHFAVLAQTGAGKSYLTGVLIEEMLEQDLPVLIIDPHGEYHSLARENPDSDETRSYEINEYSPNTDINSAALPLTFSSVNMDKKEILNVLPDSLTNSQMGVMYNALKRLQDKGEDYNLTDLMDAVSQEDSTAKWNLLNSLEQLDDSGLFSENPIDLEDLLTPGEATIINLRAVEPEAAEMTMYMLAKKLFDLRKTDRVPPFIMVMEEAHNFVPEKGFEQALSNKIMRKIASEGRKFGLGIGVISQRPARIDKNVLSQCNTQFVLRVTNPNDLKAISKSFEGITSEVESMIKSLPPGVAFVLGNEYPVMTEVRTRYSEHGGETQTSENYVKKEKVEIFKPEKDLKDLESETGQKYEAAYYPLYLVENGDEELLIDAVSGEVKQKSAKLASKEKEVVELIQKGKEKQHMMEELDISLSKLSNLLDNLRGKKRVHEDKLEVKKSFFDIELVEERVDSDKIIDREVDKSQFDGFKKVVYYPYYSRDDTVYDPILDKQLE